MSTERSWAAVQLLAEPTRARVYDVIRSAREPMTREQVARAAGITTQLAAFHLDLLAEGGLLDVDFARPPGRRGPGAGRPAKRYNAVDGDVSVSVPERHYDLVARLLAGAVSDSAGGDAWTSALHAAEVEGRALGERQRPAGRLGAGRALACAVAALSELGYEPVMEGRSVRLRNCPFHAVVAVAPQLVCGMNERLVVGLLQGLGAPPTVSADLEPAPPDCCVSLRARR